MKFKKYGFLLPLLLAGNLQIISNSARAAEQEQETSTANTEMQKIPSVSQIETGKTIPQSKNITINQITSVSQLKDVQPTEWGYEALRSLVERYGCIVGYPNATFRGDKAISRWEFAAGLNACLNTMERLIQEGSVSKEDLDKLKRLTSEFQSELAALGAKVDNLESRVAVLENHQFSTTTKLSGLTFLNITGLSGNNILANRDPNNNSNFSPPVRDPVTNQPSVVRLSQPQTTFSYLTWLTLNTSFTGKDLLITQLAVGNGNSPANNLASAGYYNQWGVPYTDQTAGPNANEVVIRELSYQFPVGNTVNVVIGPRINFYRYFGYNPYTFFLTGAGSFDSIGSTLSNPVDRGSGAVITWDITKEVQVAVAYLGQNTEFLPAFLNTSNNPTEGLFGATNSMTAQVTYNPSKDLSFGLFYTRSSSRAVGGYINGADANPLPYGYADDGQGGPINNGESNAIIGNFSWTITPKFAIFGRYSYGNTAIYPLTPGIPNGEVDVQSWQVGLGFPDLGKEGALGVISFEAPTEYIAGRQYLLSGAGNGGNQYELEFSYFYPLTNNIAIVPSFYCIWNANNFNGNPGVYVGNLRAQFSF